MTDIVVLVVAADDGVKPQTREVIELLKETDIGIVVALTKCDKAGVNPVRSSQLLARNQFVVLAYCELQNFRLEFIRSLQQPECWLKHSAATFLALRFRHIRMKVSVHWLRQLQPWLKCGICGPRSTKYALKREFLKLEWTGQEGKLFSASEHVCASDLINHDGDAYAVLSRQPS